MHAVHILVVLRLFKLLRVSTMISGESARNVMSFGVQLSSLRAHFLRLMSGAAYSTPVLNRASMTSARRVYILGNSETGAADADDRQTVLITCTAFATLKAYIRNVEMLEDEDTSAQQSQLRLVDQSFPSRRKLSRDASSRASGLQTTLFVKILRQRSRRMLEELILRDERASLRDRVKILCVEEMKMQILARACMCPGFSAFISNLCRSTSSKLIDKTRVLLDAAPRSRHSGESDEDLGMNPDVFEEHPSDIAWCQEYVDGAANEIYQVPTGSAFSGLTFAEMSIILFEEAGILVLGLSMRSSSDLDARILLNPSDFVIPADPSKIRLQSLVIAPDLAEAGLANVDAQPGKVTGAKPSTTAKSFRFGLGRSSRKPHTILLARSNVPESRTSGTPKAYGASHTLPSSPKAGRNTQPRLALDRDADTENPAEAVPEDTTEDPQDRYEASYSSDASEHSPAQACLFGDRGGLPANEYHLAPREFCQEDVLVYKSALSEVPGLRKHVIVYGDGADCSELVLQLRGRKTGLAAPIIILSRGPIGHRSWNRINQFAQVYLVRGPPELTSTWPDEETLLLYNLVLKENRRVRVSCVLRHNVNVQYMQRRLSTTEVLPNLNDDEELLLSSAIASGTVLCDELFDTIMAQTNYNPHLLKLLSALLKGSRNGVQKATNSEAHASQFHHLGVTPEMARLSYGEVFRILASRAILPVYLHRGVERDTRRGHLGNPEPYVVTSPIGATRLFVVDSLICLALQNPLRGEAIPELGIEPEDTAELDGFAYDLEPVSSGSFSTVATTETTEMSGPVRGVDRAAVEAGQQDTEDAIQEHKRAAKRAKLLRQRDELEACKASLRQQIQDVREYLALVRASVQM
ncbi:Calcium-activated potassium channel subunit alpha-1 [Hondaea fermentalgiana]|uniref:Calcium-activated potassium channel subunit alpha-1 n=1 Tax=Hondaea fermentalgiana TaxID=2315210 RepID=A0A2R5GMJ2_9STRA|nr:Calcium-activated potassium channel subunit alpha-1 [Hondaea fermentalgiana]|eukprot:GBG29853.1 Calcium-activated potassium channel subunit alpha-1 [Hondaea fermentalgiana]